MNVIILNQSFIKIRCSCISLYQYINTCALARFIWREKFFGNAIHQLGILCFEIQGWLGRKRCINEEVIINGFAKVKHVPVLSHVKEYNQLIEKLVKGEVKAVKKKSGIWKDDVNYDGIFYRTWSWLKNRLFRR